MQISAVSNTSVEGSEKINCSFYRRMNRADSAEMEDFEQLLIANEIHSDSDFPPEDNFQGI